ncbi:MAG TPA: glycosyltransferase [Verrucomicrobiae bacterium]|nr:glycosyltransferase [Verrucomicrobiae bacterium]
MKAAVLTASISRAGGGVYESCRRLAQSMMARDSMQFEVFGLKDPFTDPDLPSWNPLHPRAFAVQGPRGYGYAPGLQGALQQEQPDLAHVHGIWMYPSLAASRWARHSRRPYLVTLHGMMEPFALQASRLKKRVALALVEHRVLREAACLHVLTEQELASVRSLGLRNPVCVIPNGVDIPQEGPEQQPPWTAADSSVKTLLYLGRIHPEKGLFGLLQAMAMLVQRGDNQLEGWRLVIAGWDQNGHEAELQKFVRAHSLAPFVEFVGPQFGSAKSAAMHEADAFVLPSFSEGLPMAVLEAWAHRLPVLMTPECRLAAGFAAGAALRIEANPESIARGLLELFALDDMQRISIGESGWRLVNTRYRWPSVAAEMRNVYEWMTAAGPKPDTVEVMP